MGGDGAATSGATEQDRKYVRTFKSDLTQNDKEILHVLSTKDIFADGKSNNDLNGSGMLVGQSQLMDEDSKDGQRTALNNDFQINI